MVHKIDDEKLKVKDVIVQIEDEPTSIFVSFFSKYINIAKPLIFSKKIRSLKNHIRQSMVL